MKFGIISSMSENFCNDCNRLRISSLGELQLCLFGDRVVSLKNMIDEHYSYNEIFFNVQKALGKKFLKHNGDFFVI